jgi:hypothetical protein
MTDQAPRTHETSSASTPKNVSEVHPLIRRCVNCNRIFEHHQQYIGSSNGIVCRAVIACEVRAQDWRRQQRRARRAERQGGRQLQQPSMRTAAAGGSR